MIWFVRRVTALLAATLLAVGGSTGFGRLTQDAESLAVLHMDLCARGPCVAGIVPGATTLGEANALLARARSAAEAPDGSPAEIRLLTATLGGAPVVPIETMNALLVTTVYLTPREGRTLPGIGAFLTRFGRPCVVGTTPDLRLSLVYPTMMLMVEPGTSPEAGTRPYAIMLIDARRALSMPDLCAQNWAQPYGGLRSFEHYYADFMLRLAQAQAQRERR